MTEPRQRLDLSIGLQERNVWSRNRKSVSVLRIRRYAFGPALPLPFPETGFGRMRIAVLEALFGVMWFHGNIIRVAVAGAEKYRTCNENNGAYTH